MFALFNAIDDVCSFLPEALRLALYGLIVGILAMLIYRWTSPQKRLKSLKLEMADARQAMKSYTGTDAKEMLRLSLRSIAPALRQLLLVFGPTLLAMAPVLLVVLWLEAYFSCRLPNPGDGVVVTYGVTTGLRANLPRWEPADAVIEVTPLHGDVIRWPALGQTVTLIDAPTGMQIVRLPLDRPVRTIRKPHWWGALLEGSARIELPADLTVPMVEFDLPARHVWSIGPTWMRTWHTPFMIALTIAALGMKFVFKIH